MFRFLNSFRMFRVGLIVLAIALGLFVGLTLPTVALAAGPGQQTAPIEGSIVPAGLQLLLIVLVTQGIKSLAKTLGGTNADGTPKIDLSDKAGAYAYVAVGVVVYAIQTFVLPALSPALAAQLAQFLAAIGVLLAGSGLYSMTSALRVQSK